MILATKRLGDYEYNSEDSITFAKGIPGFNQCQNFILIEVDDSPFMYLQSTSDGDVSFVVASPFDFFPEYEFDLNESIKKDLLIRTEADLKVVNMISVRGNLQSATINLAAPIIINAREGLGEQYILDNGKYSIQHPLFSSQEETRRD